MASITIDSVTKTYPNGVVAIDELTLNVADGEFLVLVGPSGCGKTTMLRSIAGLEGVTSGRILLGDRDITDVPARDRDMAMVFQNYALYPHMTVRKNLSYGLRVRRTPRAEAQRRVAEVATLLGLEELLERRPAELSGGQRQRVAMGRAIVRRPSAFLMDEPLSNLDAQLRVGMRASLARLHRQLGVTTLYVTHDQVEAMTLGQRIAVMSSGVIQQTGTPHDVYSRPANLFVATFIGSPMINLFHAIVEGSRIGVASLRLPVHGAVPDGPVTLGVRPEDVVLYDDEREGIVARIEAIEELGSETYLLCAIEGITSIRSPVARDDRILAEDVALAVVRVDNRRRAEAGDLVRIGFDANRVHLFDERSGARLDTAPRARVLAG